MESWPHERRRLNDAFRQTATQIQIVSFYETVPTRVGSALAIIVEKQSALLNIAGEIIIAQNARHHDLCKFANESDPNYKHVLHQLRSITGRSALAKDQLHLEDHDEPSQTPASSWIPNIASKKGNTSSGLLEMASSIEDPADFSDAQADIIAIHGLGGSSLRSWTSNRSKVMWLRELLQAKFSDCRVLSYGYRPAFSDKALDIQGLAADFVANIEESRTAERSKRVSFSSDTSTDHFALILTL